MARPPSPVRALRKPRQPAAAPEGQKPRGGDVEIFVRARWHGGLMSLVSLSLVVLAAFIHATWNLLSKRAADAGATFVFAYNLFACLVYLPWMIWLLIYGDLHWNIAFCLVLSAAIHLAYSLCLQRGYQVADLSVVYPIARGTGPMLSSIGAFMLLRETPTTQGIFGLLAVVAGIGFISTQGDLSAFRKARGLDGVRWGGATGSLIA